MSINEKAAVVLMEFVTVALREQNRIIDQQRERIAWQDAKLEELSGHFNRMTADLKEMRARWLSISTRAKS